MRKKSRKLPVFIVTGLILIVLACAYIWVSGRDRNAAASSIEAGDILFCTDDILSSAEDAVLTAEKEAAKASDWKLLLVNPWNRIPEGYEVTTASSENGYLIDERVKDSLEDMLSDCRAAGYSPQIISAFRTHETQQYLYERTANKSDTAFPGTSEHECGLAADIIDSASAGWGDPLIDKQETMPAQKWLMAHCQDYGFILRYPKDKEDITGIIYEPWHYRYVGREYAKEIMEKGICLEEYLGTEADAEKEKIRS